MSSSAAPPHLAREGVGVSDATDTAREISRLWWVWLVAGVAWIVAALVILQFDSASVTTIGVIIGAMFAGAAIQQFVLAAIAPALKWLWALFGVFFAIAAGVCFFNPAETFAGTADVLGFLFLIVGVWWTIRAFLVRDGDPLWWLSLISGLLMVILAFWTSGQFFIEKAYTLLVFAGIWALMHGITDIVRALQVRSIRDEL